MLLVDLVVEFLVILLVVRMRSFVPMEQCLGEPSQCASFLSVQVLVVAEPLPILADLLPRITPIRTRAFPEDFVSPAIMRIPIVEARFLFQLRAGQ